MLANSFKFKGHECFKNDWSGLDEFKPISVIIGRNNTGKSQLLDVLELLTSSRLQQLDLAYYGSGTLDADSLQKVFNDARGGNLPGNHWRQHGQLFVGKPIEWQCESKGSTINVVSLDEPTTDHISTGERRERIIRMLTAATTPIYECKFRRLLSDRDVQPEPAAVKLALAPDGKGATNIIRRFILADLPEMREELIQGELLNALSHIFGADGSFTRIEMRHRENADLWEVFLGEPQKGLIALSSSGSGLKTIILVLLNLLVVPELEKTEKQQFVFAFEELENNLHPALLRRLFQYLADYVEREKCKLFLTTHSSVALDFFGTRDDTQIIHVTHDGESASTRTIAAHFDQVMLLTELGSRPSDLLQANGVIWLEGPSDRIYFNRFIELYSDGTLREGRDYQCVFYGGSILANSTFTSPEDADETFVNLLRLNHNIAVICDGDRTTDTGAGSKIKKRVQRIKKEVKQIPGAFLWVTDAKEIENYIPGSVWAKVYKTSGVPDPEKYATFPTSGLEEEDFVQKNLKRKSFDKCEFAMKAVGHLTREALSSRFEMEDKMISLVEQIRTWNK